MSLPRFPNHDVDPPTPVLRKAQSWLRALDAVHPEITRSPQREGYQRGIDAYRPDQGLEVLSYALELFNRANGRFPDPVALPETRDCFFVLKFFEPIPLSGPADKLGVARYLPADCRDGLFQPARPWTSTRAELPCDDAVPPGRYVLKLALGFEQNIPLGWPPSAQERERIAKTLRKWFLSRHGVPWGEWWYGIGEQRVYLEEDLSERMRGRTEVKIFVRDGQPVLGYSILHDFATGVHGQRFFDRDLRPVEALTRGYRPLDAPLPESIGRMMDVASAAGRQFRLVRVDFIDVGGIRPCLGELTLCDQNACRRYDPPGFDGIARKLLFA